MTSYYDNVLVGVASGVGAARGGWVNGVFRHAESGKAWTKLSQKWSNVSRRVRKAQNVPKDNDLHHWAISRNGKLGKKVPDAIKNHPANLKSVPRDIHQRIHGNHPTQPKFDPLRRWHHGTPNWAKAGEVSLGTGIGADTAIYTVDSIQDASTGSGAVNNGK